MGISTLQPKVYEDCFKAGSASTGISVALAAESSS